jgi:hypothetical protein
MSELTQAIMALICRNSNNKSFTTKSVWNIRLLDRLLVLIMIEAMVEDPQVSPLGGDDYYQFRLYLNSMI